MDENERLRSWLNTNAYTCDPDIRFAVAWIENLLAQVRVLKSMAKDK